MADPKNRRLGRYEILGELGRGAMGIVYKARDPRINRLVAVKTISLDGQPPEEEQQYRARFLREAEAAGRLSHPGIVAVFDVGEEPETRTPFIVMEYVAGQSLDKLLLSRHDRKLPADKALQITLEIAEALEAAHSQGVVHRDLKPANILMTQDGHAKIADFGVAKLNLANATLAGRTLGTPAYMSPEQLNDEPVDGRSDLFSLGVILYTVLTGYRPFQGNSAMTVAFKVVHRDPIPATVLETHLTPGLDYIISRAIAKNPDQRYQSGREMARDIQDLREGREDWDKVKQIDSAPAMAQTTEKTGASRTRSSSFSQVSEVAFQRSGQNTLTAGAAQKPIAKVGKRFFTGSLLLIGLLFFVVRTDHFLWSRAESSRKVETPPPSVATLTAPEKTAQNTVASTVTTVTPAPPKPAPAAPSPKPPAKSTAAPAMLEIEIDHNFADAQLAIWVDEELTYTHPLAGVDKKRLVVFHHIHGHEFHAVEISPGKHLLRVQVSPNGEGTGVQIADQSGTVNGEFSSGAEKMLSIHFDNNSVMNLSLQ